MRAKSRAGGVITQQDLRKFRALRARSSKLKQRYERERQRLLNLVESHAAVEPGRLRIAVNQSVCRRVTKAFLVSVHGEKEYERMRGEAPPTVYRTIVIKSQSSPPAAAPGEARPWP